MYNEELKRRFIREYTHSIATANACESVFNVFEKSETEWGADLCTKSSEDLQPIINIIVGFRARSKWARLTILKDYVKWCIDVAKVPGVCDGMLKICDAGLEKFRLQTVPNPLGMQRYLNSIFDAEIEETTDNIYRCYYWLAYGGVEERDILSVKISDVDLSNMVIHYNDTEIPIYREAIQAFKNCCNLTYFTFNHPHYTKTVRKPRVDGNTLVRGIRSLPTTKSMRVELSRKTRAKASETDIRLSYYRAWISGVFYRTLEREIAGEKPNFDWVASQHMRGKSYKLDKCRNTPEAKKRQLAKDYMEDYQRWKLAFRNLG